MAVAVLDFPTFQNETLTLINNTNTVNAIRAPYIIATTKLISLGTVQFPGGMSSALTIITPNDQIIFQPNGVGPTLTFNIPAPAVSEVVNFPDPAGSANVIYDVSTQSISGAKTFSSAVTLTPATNQIVIQPSGAGTTLTLNATNPAVSRVVTFPDPGAAATVIYDVSAQTLSGVKTFSNTVIFNGLVQGSSATPSPQSFGAITANSSFGVLTFNSGANVTAGGVLTAVVTNSVVTANSIILTNLLALVGNAASSGVVPQVSARAAGSSFTLSLFNPTATAVGAGVTSLIVGFVVIN